jgi:hypothetical protein
MAALGRGFEVEVKGKLSFDQWCGGGEKGMLSRDVHKSAEPNMHSPEI